MSAWWADVRVALDVYRIARRSTLGIDVHVTLRTEVKL